MKPCRACEKSGLVEVITGKHPNPGKEFYTVERRSESGEWISEEWKVFEPEPGVFSVWKPCGDCGGFGYTGHPDDTPKMQFQRQTQKLLRHGICSQPSLECDDCTRYRDDCDGREGR